MKSRPDTPFRPFRRRADNPASCPLRREGWTRTIKELLLTCASNWRRNYCAETPLSRGLTAYQFSPAEGLVRQFSSPVHSRSASRGAYDFAYWNDLLKRLQHFLCFFRSHLLPISAGLLFRQVRQESPFWIGPLVIVAGLHPCIRKLLECRRMAFGPECSGENSSDGPIFERSTGQVPEKGHPSLVGLVVLTVKQAVAGSELLGNGSKHTTMERKYVSFKTAPVRRKCLTL